MRGSVTKSRFGLMPNFTLKYLLQNKRIRKNLKNPLLSNLILFDVSLMDLIRERIIKPLYHSLPLSFKIWYDKARYRV